MKSAMRSDAVTIAVIFSSFFVSGAGVGDSSIGVHVSTSSKVVVEVEGVELAVVSTDGVVFGCLLVLAVVLVVVLRVGLVVGLVVVVDLVVSLVVGLAVVLVVGLLLVVVGFEVSLGSLTSGLSHPFLGSSVADIPATSFISSCRNIE